MPSSSSKDPRNYRDFVLYAPSNATQDWRHHLLKFAPLHKNVSVDIGKFQGPVMLNRRDERALRDEGQAKQEDDASETADAAALTTAAQGKHAGRDESLVAPGPGTSRNADGTGGPAVAAIRKRRPFEKKTSRVFQTDASLASRKLARQEQYPWLLEDASGKERWVGRMTGSSAGLGGINDGATGGTSATKAGSHVLFRVRDTEAGMDVLPIDRSYRFAPKQSSRNADADEAELEVRRTPFREHKFSFEIWNSNYFMLTHALYVQFERRSKSKVADRWGQRTKAKAQQSGLAGAKDEPLADPVRFSAVHGQRKGGRVKKEAEDEFDEVEFEEEMQDDEEGAGTYGDDIMEEEEAKALEERIKRSQRGGNHLSGGVDTTQAEEDVAQGDGQKLNRAGKRAQKLLRKHRNSDEESGSEQDESKAKNPYATDSGESDDDEHPEQATAQNTNQTVPPHLAGNDSAKPKPPPLSGDGAKISQQTSCPGSRAGSPAVSSFNQAASSATSLKRKAEDGAGGERPDKKVHKREGSAATPAADDPGFARTVLTESVVVAFVRAASSRNEATAKNVSLHEFSRAR